MARVKKRSLGLFIFLDIITFGIYGLVVFFNMSNEINDICEGDGKHTMFFLWADLLGLVTFGIYPLVWYYKAMERLKDNGYRYGVMVRHSGGDFLLWVFLGSFIAVGPIVALCYFVSNVNQFADYVGIINPKRYSANPIERMEIEREPFLPGYPAGGASAIQGVSVQPQMNSAPSFSDTEAFDYSKGASGVQNNAVTGKITFLSGSDFDGFPISIEGNDVILIGTDSGMCSVVINASKKNISRKHCGISFNSQQNCYIVTDYSTNGTFKFDGTRLTKGVAQNMPHQTIIKLAQSDVILRLE